MSDSDDQPATAATPPGSPQRSSGYDIAPWFPQASEVIIRPQEDPADAHLRRFKDRVRFLIAWGVVLVVGGVALYFTISDHASSDRAAWGRTILAALVSALGGYAIGKTERR